VPRPLSCFSYWAVQDQRTIVAEVGEDALATFTRRSLDYAVPTALITAAPFGSSAVMQGGGLFGTYRI